MDHIETKILNSYTIQEAAQNMVFAARLPVLFSPKLTGPFCQRGCCEEGAMSCGIPIPKDWSPLEIMKADYPLLVEGREAVYEN